VNSSDVDNAASSSRAKLHGANSQMTNAKSVPASMLNA